MEPGTLSAIFIAPRGGEPLSPLQEARLVAERGIEGDRYCDGIGTFSKWPGSGRNVTLIEQETLDAVYRDFGLDLRAGQSRRNLVTVGLRLVDLNGQFFRIGGALLHGARVAAPCQYLEKLVPGAFEALKGRGGLRAEVIEDGVIRVGDRVQLGRSAVTPASSSAVQQTAGDRVA